VAIVALMTIKLAPSATGSGITEIMACLNGVNYPNFVGWKVLFVKSVGVVMSIGGSLAIGKEGPLAHIGCCIGVMIVYLPIPAFKYFQNEVSKREFFAAGVSAGVSAAFGSPIGGSLFAYELSHPTTFWTFDMIWRVFFCSSVSTYTLSILNQINTNGI